MFRIVLNGRYVVKIDQKDDGTQRMWVTRDAIDTGVVKITPIDTGGEIPMPSCVDYFKNNEE
jgi:hypothetical protein